MHRVGRWARCRLAGAATVVSSGTLAINTPSGSNVFLQRSLINDGSAAWTGSNHYGIGFNGGTFTNNGSFTVNSNSLLQCYSFTNSLPNNTFNNAGTFTKQGTGTTQFVEPR